MSRIIKSQWAEDKTKAAKEIQIKMIRQQVTVSEEEAVNEEPAISFGEEGRRFLEEAHSEARTIRETAHEEWQKMQKQMEDTRNAWEEEKAQLMEQAYKEGYAEGKEEGRQNGYMECSTLIEEAKHTVECSKVEFEKNVERAEKTILELAIVSAEKIIGSKLAENENEFLPVIKRAMKDARDQQEISIFVNPSQYPLVISQKDELEAMFPTDIQCYIYPNEDLSENSCFIETSHGRIDVSVDSQLQQLRKQLFDLLEGGVQ